jgi:[acyl-carrier-protein] S-malonyltransferase
MTPARDKLKDYIEKVRIASPGLSFISNVDAKVQADPARIKENLIAQVNTRTLWEESVRAVAAAGIRQLLEVGPGQVLKGLLKKIDPKLEVRNFGTYQDLQAQTQPT